MIECPKTRFVSELESLTPSFSESAIMHEKFAFLWRYLQRFTAVSNGGDIILIVGPSNSGKSQLLALLTRHLRENLFAAVEPGHLPIIGAKANPSRDSRMTPKQVALALLADGGHVLYDPERQEKTGFYPSMKPSSEDLLHTHLSELVFRRAVRYVIVDEGQLITRSKDKLFAATLLESLKSLAGSNRNLVVCGGYDLLEPALALRSHVAVRTIVLHLAPYEPETGLLEWRRILKTMSKSEKLNGLGRFLNDSALQLLTESHGCVGVLERRLKDSLAWSAAHGLPLDERMFVERRPIRLQWEAQRNDIEQGKAQLAQVEWGATEHGEIFLVTAAEAGAPSSSQKPGIPRTKKLKPFQSRPNRFPAAR
ncbi:hypothetical protein C7E15_02515 [Stenotrophomonas maltophilia]|nr:hypothetical protein C7E15_02515 [Stenotrophomonas maltophilia]